MTTFKPVGDFFGVKTNKDAHQNYKLEKKEVEIATEADDPGVVGVKYYYPDPEDFKTLNLPIKRRPWIGYNPLTGKEKSGREAFDNAMYYAPKMINDYVKHWYIDQFPPNKSPFMQSSNNIHRTTRDVCGTLDLNLQPHQKFVGAQMSNLTDFGSLLLYHSLGSGKSASSIAIAESNKGTYTDQHGKSWLREGAEVPQDKNLNKLDSMYEAKSCHVTIVVPKQVLNQFVEEIRGQLEDDQVKSFSGSCVIYSEELEKHNPDPNKYIFYRQYYAAQMNERGEPIPRNLAQIQQLDKQITEQEKKIKHIQDQKRRLQEGGSPQSDTDNNHDEELRKLNEQNDDAINIRNGYVNNRNIQMNMLNQDIKKVYFIISHQTFLNRITRDVKGDEKEYVATEYILGRQYTPHDAKELPHPSCFHSKKAVVIIDEIHKLVSDGGSNFLRLYKTLNIFARDPLTGAARVKLILLTGTPIYDNAHEAAQIINLQRPRIPFPLARAKFEQLFIDPKTFKMKNKICFQYLMSGYISYSRGANPRGFPIRKNIIKTHIMNAQQCSNYIDALVSDVKRDKHDKKTDAQKIVAGLNKIFRLDTNDDPLKGLYTLSLQQCNIAYQLRDKRTRYSEDVDAFKYMKTVNMKKDDFEDVESEEEEEAMDNIEKGLKKKAKAHQRTKTAPRIELFNNFIASLSGSKESPLEELGNISTKFHWILNSILESTRRGNSGPIIVHSQWCYNGILPMAMVLQKIGWKHVLEFIHLSAEEIRDEVRSIRQRNPSFGLFSFWSPEALSYLNLKSEHADDYLKKMKLLFNSPANRDGEIIKAIFITVDEGVSLKRVSEIHVTAPWWNESRVEQIIGRGIRFCSHSDLPVERQAVDVYYHCSILPEFLTRSTNPTIESRFRDELKRSASFKSLNFLTAEQRVFIASRRKTNINHQFDTAMKETSIDYQLNTYANLIRMEETVNPLLKFYAHEKLFYNRSENKYYVLDTKTEQLYETTMNDSFVVNEVDKDGNIIQVCHPVWPPMSAVKLDEPVNIVKKWGDQYSLEKVDKYTSIIVTELFDNFNASSVAGMTFKELRQFAIRAGEEKEVWNYFEDRRIRKELMEILIASYGLSMGYGGTALLMTFYESILTESDEQQRILKNTGTKEILTDLQHIIEQLNIDHKQEMVNTIQYTKQHLPPVEKLNDVDLKSVKDRMRKIFFDAGAHNDELVEILKNDLIQKYGYTPQQVKSFNYQQVMNEVMIAKAKKAGITEHTKKTTLVTKKKANKKQ